MARTASRPGPGSRPAGRSNGAVSPIPPSTRDAELAAEIHSLFQQARSYRRPLVQQWNRNYRILRNRTWTASRPSWMPSPEVPEIHPIVASLVGWMTDQRPTFEAIPAYPPHSPNAEFYSTLALHLKTTLQALWAVHEYDLDVEQAVWDSYIYGTGLLKSGWDDTLDLGLGNAVMRRVDPYLFYPDPGATSMRDANYFIEVRTMSLQEMDRRWPGSAGKVTPVTEDGDERPNLLAPGNRPMANPGAIGGGSNRYGLPGQSRLSGGSRATGFSLEDPGVTVLEAWIRQHSTQEVKGGPRDGETEVLDTWRVIVVAGSQVLMDEDALDIFPWGGHPYDRFVAEDSGEFWGLSLVDLLIPAQLSINRILASIQHNIELTGNPVFKESNRSGIQRTRITNKPGQRVTFNEGTTADWMPPPQLHPMMMPMIQWYIGEMERVSGLAQISRAISPGGRNAASVHESVQEASFVRVRTHLRSLERCLRSQAEKIASIVVHNYTMPRLIATMGPDGQQTAMYLKGRHFFVPTPKPDDPTSESPLRFQLMVQAGSSLPTSRERRSQEADVLFAMGAIDVQAVLEAHDYPNRNQITRRVMEAQAMGMGQAPGARERAGRTS